MALCCVFAAYMGFESAALYSEECRDPRRTVARATYIAVGLIGVFYAVTAWAMISGAGTGQATKVAAEQGPEMLFFLSDRSDGLGTTFSDFAQLFLITSLLAALLSFHNAVARYVRSLGREGVLPRGLGALHRRHGSPHRGSLLQTALTVAVIAVFALAGRDPVADVFTWLTNLGALGVILLLLATSAAVVGYFARRRELSEPLWHRLIAPVLSGVALAVIFWLALTNFSVQLGVSSGNPLRWILPCLILIAAAAGIAWGLYLRKFHAADVRGDQGGGGSCRGVALQGPLQQRPAVPDHADLPVVRPDRLLDGEGGQLLRRRIEEIEFGVARPRLAALEGRRTGGDEFIQGEPFPVDGGELAVVGHGVGVDEAIRLRGFAQGHHGLRDTPVGGGQRGPERGARRDAGAGP